MTYTNCVVGPVQLSKIHSYYINYLLVDEAMGIVLNDFKVVLTEFYSKGENIVDVINFLYDGNL